LLAFARRHRLKLTFKFQGGNFRLTSVAGDVIHKLIA
jgi:hypothetical protein